MQLWRVVSWAVTIQWLLVVPMGRAGWRWSDDHAGSRAGLQASPPRLRESLWAYSGFCPWQRPTSRWRLSGGPGPTLPDWADPQPSCSPLRVRPEDILEWNCRKVVLGIHGGSETKDMHLGETQRDPGYHLQIQGDVRMVLRLCHRHLLRGSHKAALGVSCLQKEEVWFPGPAPVQLP